MENKTNWQRLGSPFAETALKGNSVPSGQGPPHCLTKGYNLLVGNTVMKGSKFTERKQRSEGNQVLLSVLQHLHQNLTTVAVVAAPSPTTVMPGLVPTRRKTP